MAITDPVLIPINEELGKTFWDKLEEWGNRLNEHTHDGDNSEKIDIANINRSGTSGLNIHIDEAVSGTQHDFDLSTYTNIDARLALIQLRNADDNYNIEYGIKITAINANTVRLTSTVAMSFNARLIVRGE